MRGRGHKSAKLQIYNGQNIGKQSYKSIIQNKMTELHNTSTQSSLSFYALFC